MKIGKIPPAPPPPNDDDDCNFPSLRSDRQIDNDFAERTLFTAAAGSATEAAAGASGATRGFFPLGTFSPRPLPSLGRWQREARGPLHVIKGVHKY